MNAKISVTLPIVAMIKKHLVSPYVKNPSPQSKIVFKLMDESDMKYGYSPAKASKFRDTGEVKSSRASKLKDRKLELYREMDGKSLRKRILRKHDLVVEEKCSEVQNEDEAKTEVAKHAQYYVSNSYSLASTQMEIDNREKNSGGIRNRRLLFRSGVETINSKNQYTKTSKVVGAKIVRHVYDMLWNDSKWLTSVQLATIERYDRCFTVDWNKVVLKDIVQDAVELTRIRNCLKEEYPFVLAIFQKYAAYEAVETGRPYQIKNIEAWISDYSLTMGKPGLYFPKGSNALSRSDFLRTLLLAAKQKFLDGTETVNSMVLIEGVEFSASLKRLIHILHTRSSIPDTNYFRNYLFLFQDVEDEFIRHDTDLTRIFQESATQTMEKDQVVHLLQFPSYIQLMNKLNMYTQAYSVYVAANQYTICSKLEITPLDSDEGLTFASFLEIIGRMAYINHQKLIDEAIQNEIQQGLQFDFPSVLKIDLEFPRESNTNRPSVVLFASKLRYTINSIISKV